MRVVAFYVHSTIIRKLYGIVSTVFYVKRGKRVLGILRVKCQTCVIVTDVLCQLTGSLNMFQTIRMVLLGAINTYSKQVIIIWENSLLRTVRILKPGK